MLCPFCDKNVPEFHPASHVVPRWMYDLSFPDDKKTYSVDFSENKIKFAQDGFKGSFICRDCEEMCGKDEGYARLVFGPKTKGHDSVPNISDGKKGRTKTQFGFLDAIGLVGFDFRKIQKFVLGTILKGHIAKTGTTSDLLGEKHFSKMKEVYFGDAFHDDVIYPIFALIMDKRLPTHNIVDQPCRSKTKEGMNIVSFKGGGYEFNVSVQSHPVPKDALNFRLTKAGEILVLHKVENIAAIRRVIQDAKQLKANRWKLDKGKSRD